MLDSPMKSQSLIPFYTQRCIDHVEEGYPSRELADHWQERSCGVACARMVIEALTAASPPSPWPLIEQMVARGAYLQGKGWVHAGIANFLNDEYGLNCTRRRVESIDELVDLIASGALLIASVAVGFEGESKSGHLILVHGITIENQVRQLMIHHPSSWESYEWRDKPIPVDRFWKHFSGNIIECRH